MTRNERELLAEQLECAAEVFSYYVEKDFYCKDSSIKESRIRAEVAMATIYNIAKMLGIENAYKIKEAGIKQGKEKYAESHRLVAEYQG